MSGASVAKVQAQLFSMAHDDKVANVRYNTLRAIKEITKHVKDNAFLEKAKKCFQDCSKDKDLDVSSTAKKYAQECG